MYVEPDCNLISGESLVRQLLHGKKFFKEEFDVDSQILFLPDVFGYSGALPQILKKSGINYFVTSKISWNDRNTMPVDSFLWEGIDGTEIYTTFITTQDAQRNHEITNHTTYTGLMTPSHVLGTWDRYQQKEYNKHVFTTYGYGDGGILVFNSLGFARGGNILVNGKTIELTETIPAFGWKVLTPSTENYVIVTDNTLENNHYIISLDETGRIISLFDKKAARELVKPGGKMNEFQAYDDHPYCYDAWEISPYYKNNCYLLEEPAIITPVTDGSRSGFKIIKKYMDSTITQYIWLYTHSRRIDFDNEIDWHQKHQLLKIAFPLDIHTNNATYEIQYGHVTRPTHSNTSWDEAKYEVCAHKWADLSEKGYGVSLLNDCKYGYSTEGSTIKLTALKCASYPYPQADEGKHIFSFALLPHSGDLYDGGIIQEAYSFNQPLDTVLLDEQHGCLPDTFSLVSCDAPNVIIETVKKAEDGDDMIVRLYEAWDSRGPVTLTVSGDFKGVRLCNLMEEDMEDMKELEFRNNRVTMPIKNFEIVTLRFVR